MNPVEFLWSAIGLVLSLMVFSFLIGDNFLYRLAISLFIGVTAGYATVVILFQVIYPRLIVPLIRGSGTFLDLVLIALIPLILSILLVFLLNQKLRFLGKIPLAMMAGAAAAYAIAGAVLGTLIPQTSSAIQLFSPGLQAENLPEVLVVTLGTISTLAYFYFGVRLEIGKPLRRPKWIEGLSMLGKVFLFMTLGGILAGVLTSAITALVERLNAFWNIIQLLLP